jgi:hypothetical protein
MMSEHDGESRGGDLGWLALIGAAAGLGAAWLAGRSRPAGGRVGAHAWLVPSAQSRREAEWTRHAVVHASEASQTKRRG